MNSNITINERRIKLSNGRVYVIDEEILIHEVFQFLEFAEKCKTESESDEIETEFNNEFLKYSDQVESLIGDDDFLSKLILLSRSLNRMEIIKRLMEETISINVFNNKYGQKYLKAKSAIPEYIYENGKKKVRYKTISQHLGKLDDYKGGVKDEKVIKIARKELLKKAINTVRIKFMEKR